ncbi:hypothetical protein FOZ63_009859, partial [Perkinsus olseni]
MTTDATTMTTDATNTMTTDATNTMTTDATTMTTAATNTMTIDATTMTTDATTMTTDATTMTTDATNTMTIDATTMTTDATTMTTDATTMTTDATNTMTTDATTMTKLVCAPFAHLRLTNFRNGKILGSRLQGLPTASSTGKRGLTATLLLPPLPQQDPPLQEDGEFSGMPDESHKPQAAAHVEMCRQLRVTKTIAIGGGVGLILPNRDQWNAAIAAVSTDTTLVVKE